MRDRVTGVQHKNMRKVQVETVDTFHTEKDAIIGLRCYQRIGARWETRYQMHLDPFHGHRFST
jgi:hypothetical protein